MNISRLGRMAFRNKVKVSDVEGGFPLPYGYRAGLVISNDTATDALHDIQVAVGSARSAGDSGDIKVTSVITKQIDVDWTAGNNAGGFPDDALNLAADTWYHVHVLGNANGDSYDAGFDTSVTAANLLADGGVSAAGFTTYRRVGSVRTDSSSNILAFTQVGNHFIWADPIGQAATNTQDAHITTALNGLPPDVSVFAELNVQFQDASAITAGHVYSPDANEKTPTVSGTAPFAQFDAAAGDHALRKMWVRTDTSAQIKHYVDGASTMTQANYAVLGWQDDLGDFD